jgi:BNR repeat-like domain
MLGYALRIDSKFVVRTAVAALAVTACGHRDETGFSPEVVVSSATANGATPMFLVSATGARVLSWVAADSGGAIGTLHLQVERAGTAPIVSVLSDPLGGIEPHGEAPPQLAASASGAVYALYTVGKDVGGRYPLNALRFARSDDSGRNWSVPVSVNEGAAFGAHSFQSIIASAAGDVYAAWLNNDPDSGGVFLRSSHDGGKTWAPSHPISRLPACPCCRTALALAGDGTLYAAWREVFPGDVRDIVVASSSDQGATWSTPVRPHVDGWVFPGCPHTGPSLKVDQHGALHIGWWTGRAGAAGVWYARSSDKGLTWAAQPLDTASTSRPSHLQLALDGGSSVVATWDEGMSKLPGILVRASGDGGSTFAAASRLTRDGVAGAFPVIGIFGDSVTVAWTQTTDAAYKALQAHEPNEADPNMKMPLPRVGQQEVFSRRGALSRVIPKP